MQQFVPNHHNAAAALNHDPQQQQQQQQQHAALFNHQPQFPQPHQQQAHEPDPFVALAFNPALKMRLELWKKEEEVVSQRIERKELRLQNTKNEIYQLLGIYFVFQGVILTAIAQASNLPKAKFWIPLVLSVLASFSTILALWYKLADCSDLEKHIVSEKTMAKALYQASDTLKSMGDRFNPQDFSLQPRVNDWIRSGATRNQSLVKRLWENHMREYGALLILILVIFSIIMAVSCCLIHSSSNTRL